MKLTFGLFFVTFLLPLPACQATGLGAVAEIALPLLGVRDEAVPAVFGRVLAGVHGIVAVRALVVVVAGCPPSQLAHWLLRLG
jgi:hypothetical protein